MNLEKHLLLFTQLRDLEFPMILALSMSDIAEKEGLKIKPKFLEQNFNCPIVQFSSRTGEGIENLKNHLTDFQETPKKLQAEKSFYTLGKHEREIAKVVQNTYKEANAYQALLWVHHHEKLPFLNSQEHKLLQNIF